MLNVIRIANAFVLVPELEAFIPHLVSLFMVSFFLKEPSVL